MSIHKIASETLRLKEDNLQLSSEVQALKTRVEEFEKRASAEKILVEALSTNTSLRAHDVEEFLAKRAQLEQKSDKQLEKIAHSIELIKGGEELMLSDYSVNNDRNFVDWLKSR